MADKVKQGIDVLICGYRLVQTGSDLVDFPKNCWFGVKGGGIVDHCGGRKVYHLA